jgi:hypothetical protein
MSRSRYYGAFVLAVVACCVVAASASGEFESPKKETTGKGEAYELRLEAGGGTVLCRGGTTKLTWTIEQEGKATVKGGSLLSDLENAGECTAESSELTSSKATFGECKLEVKQPKAEEEVLGRLTKTCTITAGSCEIELEGKENEHLERIALDAGGTEDENLFLEPLVNNIATTTKGTCPGIKGTKSGRLTGIVELQEDESSLRPEFVLSVSPKRYTVKGEGGKVKIINVGAAAQRPSEWVRHMSPGGTFEINAAQEQMCEEKVYARDESCEFGIEWPGDRGYARWSISQSARPSRATAVADAPG